MKAGARVGWGGWGERRLIRAAFPLLTCYINRVGSSRPTLQLIRLSFQLLTQIRRRPSVHSSCIYKCMLTPCQQSGIERRLITSRFRRSCSASLCIYGQVSWLPPTINHVNWFTDKMSVRAHSRSAAAPQLLFNLCPAIVHLFN